MVRIAIRTDCGNAPKKQLLRDLNIAFARADVEAILSYFSDDVTWQIIGSPPGRGKNARRIALEAMNNAFDSERVIRSIFTRGGRADQVDEVFYN